MKKIILLSLSILFLSSCSFLTEDDVVLNLPPSIPIENMSRESVYYNLFFFFFSEVKSLFIPEHVRKVRLKVKKGMLSLFLSYPADGFTPIAAYREPGREEEIVFGYSTSSLIEFLIEVANENPYIVSNLSLSSLFSSYSGDEISKRKFLSLLEKGKLTESSDINGSLFPVKLENLITGRWLSDRDDMEDIIVNGNSEGVTLNLYEGIYVYIHESLKQMVTIVVSEDGESLSKVQQFSAWY